MDIIKKCEICKKEAKNLCLVCMNYFCDSCYEFIHEKEANKQHKKEYIDYVNSIQQIQYLYFA